MKPDVTRIYLQRGQEAPGGLAGGASRSTSFVGQSEAGEHGQQRMTEVVTDPFQDRVIFSDQDDHPDLQLERSTDDCLVITNSDGDGFATSHQVSDVPLTHNFSLPPGVSQLTLTASDRVEGAVLLGLGQDEPELAIFEGTVQPVALLPEPEPPRGPFL